MDGAPSTSHTAFFVANIHCPSCVSSIEVALGRLDPPPLSISSSIVQHTITVKHAASLSVSAIAETLEDEGYEVGSIVAGPLSVNPMVLKEEPAPAEDQSLATRPRGLARLMSNYSLSATRRQQARHRENCAQCRIEGEKLDDAHADPSSSPVEKTKGFVVFDSYDGDKYLASVEVDGMTCASCVGTITKVLESKPWVERVSVNLLTKSAAVIFRGRDRAEELVSIIDDAGYDAKLNEVKVVEASSLLPNQPRLSAHLRATYSVGGMTCSACVSAISRGLKEHEWVQTVDVNLVGHSAVVVFEGKEHLEEIAALIEDMGYDANLSTLSELDQEQRPEDTQRTALIRIEGMYCDHCPTKVAQTIQQLGGVRLDERPTTKHPIVTITYRPDIPILTIRSILESISRADPAFMPTVYHPPTIEERSRRMHIREQRRILYRLLFSINVAIPTFIIGIVLMSLVPRSNSARMFIMSPIGGASRASWALFIMATPVYFFAADLFHTRMIKELRALWRRQSPTPILKRFYRFGSMNMLISLGTTIAYFSSIAELAVDASENKNNRTTNTSSPTYFDSVVFLTMFLLIGRYIEAHSKAKTGDAVAMLGKLRPTEALLSVGNDASDAKGDTGSKYEMVHIDLIEKGDTVRVPHGASPPCDGVILSGPSKFDESSLTGESRPVSKQIGDMVYSGTVNQGSAVSVCITGVAGNSMLDRIMTVVREGQTRRAPIERIADTLTGYFVPFICLIAIVTWISWLGLGLSGSLPLSYRDTTNNWAFWSLQFAIAVFVVACPCGIGLAAPTALFVGGGLAAKFGILVKGGGEAFQEASTLDCIVFDKTGTLTEGGDPVVTDYVHYGQPSPTSADEGSILAAVQNLEDDSTHPIAKAVVKFCKTRSDHSGVLSKHKNTEILGRGMKGEYSLSHGMISILVGNEALMHDHGVSLANDVRHSLDTWKREAKSVVLVAVRSHQPDSGADKGYAISAIFSISDRLRSEAAFVVQSLQKRSIDVWMISGDNPITAFAIGDKLGIAHDNIIAGVLPEQKAQKIKMLQAGPSKHKNRRTTVAMVGDGINDSPALTTADVGIAIGSGSDVAISAASFVLLTSELTALLTLIDLSRIVFRRIKFNFFWALVYNLAALPIAAGVLYPITTSSGSHVRLDPAWAALAMALSSVTVVCSSLMLRSKVPFVGFRATRYDRDAVHEGQE